MVNLLQKYKLLVYLSFLILFLCVDMIILDTITAELTTASQKLKSEAAEFKVKETRDKLDQLDRFSEITNPPYADRQEAKRLVIETIELLNNLYGGKIVEDIHEQDSSFSAKVDFSISPTSPEQLVQIVNYFETGVAPVIKIKKLTFFQQNGNRQVQFSVIVTQPYEGGTYVY